MTYLEKIIEKVKEKNPNESEFHQAVEEFLGSVKLALERYPIIEKYNILERIVEPERQVMFRVTWVNDKGEIKVNRGYRVQFNSAIGPYKGGLRFHPSVYIGIIKFLGFEQIFKNSLTGLSMGGAKGGSDFDPKGKSDMEVMRFCQNFMNELYRHLGVGARTDVPAGDIGVGGREVGFLFGQYKKITQRFEPVLTGKGLEYAGSLIRPEATGYGATYFALEILKRKNDSIKGKVCTISGSGNVAQYTAEKLIQLGAKVVTLSDSKGSVYDPDGITKEKLDYVFELKNVRRGRIKEYYEHFGGNVEYRPNKRPWDIKCDIAFPSATQNEIEENDAQNLIDNGCIAVIEGANMPTNLKATEMFIEKGVILAPGKAANAGGVAVSGLEMAQNYSFQVWSREEVDKKLQQIMQTIHSNVYSTAKEYGNPDNYVMGANIAGFIKVAKAMIAQGIV
ncbi:MAG: NADP-specific glutamate dehydrogenase [Candidatus Helarchaeota archaeon]